MSSLAIRLILVIFFQNKTCLSAVFQLAFPVSCFLVWQICRRKNCQMFCLLFYFLNILVDKVLIAWDYLTNLSCFVSNVTLNSGVPDRNVLFYGDPERRPGESAGHKTAHRQGANPISFFKNNIWWLMRLFFYFYFTDRYWDEYIYIQ